MDAPRSEVPAAHVHSPASHPAAAEAIAGESHSHSNGSNNGGMANLAATTAADSHHHDPSTTTSSLTHTTSHLSVSGVKVQESEAKDIDVDAHKNLHPTISAVGNENGAVIAGKGEKLTTTTSAVAGTDEYVAGVKFLAVFAGVTLTCFLLLLDSTIIVTAIPYITSRFHTLQDVGWYGAAYLLCNAALQPLSGKVYTYFSSKWSYLAFLFVFELGSLIAAVSTSSAMFIAGRAISGMGSSGLFNGAITIIAACIPMAKRPMYMGILMAFAQLGVLLGPVLGGLLTEYATWRWCFYLNLPCGGAVALVILLIPIPDRHTHDPQPWYLTVLHKFDLLGFALFAPAMVMLLLAVEWGGTTYAWDSARIIGLFCGFGATIALFIVAEWRAGAKAMIPLSLVSQRVVWTSCLTVALLFASLLTTSYYLPIYFQTIRGASPTMSGVYLLPTVIPMMIAAISSGILITKLGYVPVYAMISGVLSAISCGLLSLLGLHTSVGKWIGYQIIGGFGRGLGMQMAIVAVQNNTSPTLLSTAMALVMFSQTLGGALCLSFDQTLFSAELRKALRHFAPQVKSDAVVQAGATAVRKMVSSDDLTDVLRAFSRAIDRVFYLAAGASVAYAIFALGMGWRDVSGKAKAKKAEDAEKAKEVEGEDEVEGREKDTVVEKEKEER